MQPFKTHIGKIGILAISLLFAVGAVIPAVSFAATPSGSPVPSTGTGNATPTGSPVPSSGSGNTGSNSSGGVLVNPIKFNSLEALLIAVLDAVIKLGAIILTFMLVYVGFRFVAAQGNEEKIRSARMALMYTLIGGLILLGSKVILEVVQATIKSITP